MHTVENKGQLYDVDCVRQEARESIDQGAVTPDYTLDREQVFQLMNLVLADSVVYYIPGLRPFIEEAINRLCNQLS